VIYGIIEKSWGSMGGRIMVPYVPQIKMSQDFLNNFAIFNETYYAYFSLTLGANKWINIINFLDQPALYP
jgi:hypothetical protein